MTHAKRWLYLVHRWLGVLLCAFFAMWFLSGVVMMYVGYPKLTQAERLMNLPPLLSATRGPERLLEPAEALQRAVLARGAARGAHTRESRTPGKHSTHCMTAATQR